MEKVIPDLFPLGRPQETPRVSWVDRRRIQRRVLYPQPAKPQRSLRRVSQRKPCFSQLCSPSSFIIRPILSIRLFCFSIDSAVMRWIIRWVDPTARASISMNCFRSILVAVLLAASPWTSWSGWTATATAAEANPPPVSYHRQIRPILQANCQGCHQPAKQEGGYVMTEVALMKSAGDSGSVGIAPGKPDESHLIVQITPDASGQAEMPKSGKPLVAAELALVRRWIAEGGG